MEFNSGTGTEGNKLTISKDTRLEFSGNGILWIFEIKSTDFSTLQWG